MRYDVWQESSEKQSENLMGKISEPTTIELKQLLSDSDMTRLLTEASRQQLPLANLVREAIAAYLDDIEEESDEIEDTPDEEILADFRQAWHEAMTGQTRPAREVLAEIREELGLNDDQS